MLYIVLEYDEFWGLFINKEDAEKRAKEVGGYIWVYDMTEAIVMTEDGEVVPVDRPPTALSLGSC